MVDRRKQINKQPSEQFDFEINYRETMPPGAASLESLTATAKKWPRRDPTNQSDATTEILLNTSGIVVLPYKLRGRFFLIGGINNYEYQISVLATFDNGSRLEDEVYVRVREE